MTPARASLSERLYALLLRLLPGDMPQSYGADMRELFRDHLHAERRRAGLRGVSLLWLRTIPDLVTTAIHEREDEVINAISQDVRYACRILRKHPVFTVVAIVLVALGTGAVSTIFSVANAVVLRPIPGVASPGEVVTIERTYPDGHGATSVSYPYYQHLAHGARTLSGLAAWNMLTLTISTGGEGMLARATLVTGNYFDVLGARPALGRFFTPDEDGDPVARPVIVLSHELWQRRFAGDSAIVGRSILVNGQRFSVVGVAAPGFTGLVPVLRVDAWLPMMMQPAVQRGSDLRTAVGASWLVLVGRLAPGATPDAARAELAGLSRQFASTAESSLGNLAARTGVRVTSASGLPGDVRAPVLAFFTILITVAALVLMIASVDVASMLLARAAARRREMAIRLALGAGRGRLVRQLLIESIILFGAGGAVGTLIAVYATQLLSRVHLPISVPITLDLAPDVHVLVVTLAVALATGIVFGLAPALDGSRADVTSAMRGDSAAAGRARSRLRSTLVAAQVAASLLLLTTSGLFVRALARGHRIDPGYDMRQVATAGIDVGLSGYDSTRARIFYDALRDRLRANPGVTAAAYARVLPMGMGTMAYGVTVPGYVPSPGQEHQAIMVTTNFVDGDYFDVLRQPMLAGRTFRSSDSRTAPRVAIVSELFARTFWPGQSALGKTLSLDSTHAITVVGVTRDVKFSRLNEDPAPFLYLPLAQQWGTSVTLLVRSAGGGTPLPTVIRGAVRALDPTLPPPAVVSLEESAAVVLLPQRFAVIVTATLGALGLLLAAVGLYGVVSFSTTQRAREIGVRMALGAARGDVVRLIVREGMSVVAIGIGVGLVAAATTTRALRPFLFGVDPFDAATFAEMTVVLGAAALVASLLPARRAAAADPMVVLRQD